MFHRHELVSVGLIATSGSVRLIIYGMTWNLQYFRFVFNLSTIIEVRICLTHKTGETSEKKTKGCQRNWEQGKGLKEDGIFFHL